MKKFILNSTCFLSIILGIAIFLDFWISNKLQNNTARIFSTWNYVYHNTNYNELVINGSSRAWVQYDPRILDNVLKINTYNLGTDNGMINRQIIRYDKYCEFHKSPAFLIQNIDYFTMTSVYGYEVEQFYPYFYDREFLHTLDKYEKFSWQEKYIPMYRYIGKSYLLRKSNDNLYKGFEGRDMHWNDDALNAIESFYAQVDTTMQTEFRKFLSNIQSDGTKILFVYAPSYYKVLEKCENLDDMYEMYQAIADEFGIFILDYSYDSMCYDTTYFYNGTHLNKKGSELFTTKLAHDIDSIGFLKK